MQPCNHDAGDETVDRRCRRTGRSRYATHFQPCCWHDESIKGSMLCSGVRPVPAASLQEVDRSFYDVRIDEREPFLGRVHCRGNLWRQWYYSKSTINLKPFGGLERRTHAYARISCRQSCPPKCCEHHRPAKEIAACVESRNKFDSKQHREKTEPCIVCRNS